jgi:hypothetical protein
MSSKNKSERLRRLLSHGFFAPELPPCFVSSDLARYRKSILTEIDNLPQVRNKPAYYFLITEPSAFYFPRYNREDRRHAVPNAVSYLLLSRVVASNYIDIRKVAKKSKISASPPVFDWSGPRAVMRPNIDLRDDFRIDLSSRREEFAAADIRAFFHSIYTHSIPWAIYGKEWAKANRGNQHYGNLIDLLSRNMQDGQTIGLPVGPDTSRLLAEVVASGIDEQLRARLRLTNRDASRYIDDYTISAPDGRSGESLIAALRQAAAHFELELNSEKSEIVSTATRHDTGWKQAARAISPPPNAPTPVMQQFFYEVGRLCEVHKLQNVEKYAYSNARSSIVRAAEWKPVQSLLINAYRRNTTLISLVVELLILRQKQSKDVDLGNIKEFLDHRIPVLAQANRTGEIIWLLFLTIRLKVTLSERALAPLYLVQNSMIALLVVEAANRDLISGTINADEWNKACDQSGLRGQMWLYAYEAPLRGIAQGKESAFIMQDDYFGPMAKRGVSFLDIDNGFLSILEILRKLQRNNKRRHHVREDFLEDFDLDIEDFDDTDFDDFDDFDDDMY